MNQAMAPRDPVGIVGMGLIGGSLGLDLRARGVPVRALVHRPQTAERARQRGLADAVSTDPAVLAWDFEEGASDIRTYVWLKDLDYVVVMKRYSDGARRLITAYWIDYPSKRKTLQSKYARRL